MLHMLGHMLLWHAVGRLMWGLRFWQVALLALVVIVLMFGFSGRRRW
jgi:hypothetical protein